jgi:hypothetical protein
MAVIIFKYLNKHGPEPCGKIIPVHSLPAETDTAIPPAQNSDQDQLSIPYQNDSLN